LYHLPGVYNAVLLSQWGIITWRTGIYQANEARPVNQTEHFVFPNADAAAAVDFAARGAKTETEL